MALGNSRMPVVRFLWMGSTKTVNLHSADSCDPTSGENPLSYLVSPGSILFRSMSTPNATSS